MIEVERRKKKGKKKTNCYSEKLMNDDELEESKYASKRKKKVTIYFCEKYRLRIMEVWSILSGRYGYRIVATEK